MRSTSSRLQAQRCEYGSKPAFKEAYIMNHSILKTLMLLPRLCCCFLMCALPVCSSYSQNLNSNMTTNSRIAVVSNWDALAYNNSTKLVHGYDGQLHLVYHDEGEIFYTASNNNGTAWSSPINISNSAGESVFPALAVDSTRKHFIWQDDSDPNDLSRVDGKQRVWFKSIRQISDNSLRFPYPIGESVGEVLTPSLTVKDGKTLLAVWAADMGLTIGWEINISTGSLIGNGLLDLYDWTYPAIPGHALGLSSSFFPSIATVGEVSYVAWQELNVFGTYYALFKYQRSGSWSTAQNLAIATMFPSTDGLGIPSLALSNDGRAFLGFGLKYYSPPITVDDVFVVSHVEDDILDENDGVQLSDTPESDSEFKFTVSFDRSIVAAWETTVQDIGQIYFSKSVLANYDKTWSTPILASDPAKSVHAPQVVAITPDTLVFVWLEGNEQPFEIVARKYPPSATSVENTQKREVLTTPKSFELAIFPNPAHGFTNFEIKASKAALLSVKVFNIQGQVIKLVASEEISSSGSRYSWDMKDEEGRQVTNGLYFVTAQWNQFRATSKLIILR